MPPNHGDVHNFFTTHPLTLKNISKDSLFNKLFNGRIKQCGVINYFVKERQGV